MKKKRLVCKITIIIYLVILSFELFADSKTIDTRFFEITTAVKTSSNIVYAGALDDGFIVSMDMGKTWRRSNNGLPRKVVYPFDNQAIEWLTSVGFNPLNEGSVVCTTASSLYSSSNTGFSWKNIPLKSPINKSDVVTSACQSPFEEYTYLISTSFNGIFETRDGGSSWNEVSPDKIIYRGANFQEEIASIAYSPTEKGVIYLAYAYGNGLYKSNSTRTKWTKITGLSEKKSITNIQFVNTTLKVFFGDEVADYRPETNTWSRPRVGLVKSDKYYLARTSRMKRAENKKAIYLGTWHASGTRLENNLQFMEKNGLNSVVVDIKDDFGYLTYNSKLEMPNKIGAVKDRIHIDKLLKEAHKRNFYVIGRIVVFKDKQLYNYNNYEYALQDKDDKGPWRNMIKKENGETGDVSYQQIEFWVDPFKEKVWHYNIEIAQELQNLGVDEIQFDYIRLPTDGDISRIAFSDEHLGMNRINALESFLKLVREKVHIPISTDLYGFNCYYRMGNWNGQNLEMFSRYVDVVSPMWYPSHFPDGFIGDMGYIPRAEKLYYEGSLRAMEMVNGRSLIRPYIQAFLLTFEYYMQEPEYQDYLLRQIIGSEKAGSSGWALWNMSNNYYMVPEPLNEKY